MAAVGLTRLPCDGSWVRGGNQDPICPGMLPIAGAPGWTRRQRESGAGAAASSDLYSHTQPAGLVKCPSVPTEA